MPNDRLDAEKPVTYLGIYWVKPAINRFTSEAFRRAEDEARKRKRRK
jgi:hypothetical protein